MDFCWECLIFLLPHSLFSLSSCLCACLRACVCACIMFVHTSVHECVRVMTYRSIYTTTLFMPCFISLLIDIMLFQLFEGNKESINNLTSIDHLGPINKQANQ